jgi:hypothetical protein
MSTSTLVRSLIAAGLMVLLTHPAAAANTPCSGRKGGISHCQGSTFICNDGSVSGSKRNCSAEFGGGASSEALGLLGTGDAEMAPTADQADCSCRSGRYCVGPKGGHYCMTDGGRKSYLRN